jgi:hypothetical protein
MARSRKLITTEAGFMAVFRRSRLQRERRMHCFSWRWSRYKSFNRETSMLRVFVVLALVLWAGTAQATLLTFDDIVAPNSNVGVDNSFEYGGLIFGTGSFQGVWGPNVYTIEQGAVNGTQYFITGVGTGMTITATGGGAFTLNSFDLGLSFYTLPNENVSLMLNYFGGGSSTTTLNLDQSFQQLSFSGSPSLASVVIGTPQSTFSYLALDNIDFSPHVAAVPEPASLSLLALGLAGLGARKWRQRKA